MNNAAAILRALITYAICVPLAIVVGVLVCSAASFETRGSLIEFGLLGLALSLPVLLRWHYPLLLFCWNLSLTVFFLPGQPTVTWPMIALSLGISLLQRALNSNMRFLSAPQITWPLIILTIVTLFTAKMNGGIGLHAFGAEVSGGKRYLAVLAGVAGYFALTARRIPVEKSWLYMGLFLLPGCASVIGDLYSYIPRSLNFIFLFFPANYYAFSSGAEEGYTRFGGLRSAAGAIYPFMLATYGIRGIFLSGKPLRLVVFVLSAIMGLFGGFRSVMISLILLFAIQFYLEGLQRTKLAPLLIGFGIFTAVLCVPFVDKLPYSVQRSLTFLPLNFSSVAKGDAAASTEWRVKMWKAVLPEVPQHLLVGKGYGLDESYFREVYGGFQTISADEWGSAMAGDYHNGPLSVIIPLGIWGVIAFVWLLSAGFYVLNRNFRYGDPALFVPNAFLLSVFATKTLTFLFIVGGLYSDMLTFTSYLGLSVALNGGVCRPQAPAPVPETAPSASQGPMRPRLQPRFLS